MPWQIHGIVQYAQHLDDTIVVFVEGTKQNKVPALSASSRDMQRHQVFADIVTSSGVGRFRTRFRKCIERAVEGIGINHGLRCAKLL